MDDATTVVSVLRRVNAEPDNWEELATETKQALSQGLAVSTLLHGASILGTSPKFVGLLGLDPQLIASYSTSLVEDSGVARRRYQRVIGEHTRILTYDMLSECVEGYARLLRVLMSTDSFSYKWDSAVALIGRFQLEPFKVLTVWIALLLDSPAEFEAFANWARTSLWRGHVDWPAVLQLIGQWDRLSKLVSYLIFKGVIPVSRIYSLLDPGSDGFTSYESAWQKRLAQPESNALMMAMPLVDDEEEEEVVVGKGEADEKLADEEDLMVDNASGETLGGGSLQGYSGSGSGSGFTSGNPNASTNNSNKKNNNIRGQDNETKIHNLMLIFGEVLKLIAAQEAKQNSEADTGNNKGEGQGEVLNKNSTEELKNKEELDQIESDIMGIVFAHPLTFGTSHEVAQGLSNLIAVRLPKLGLAGIKQLIMPHHILEPAWSALGETVDLPFFRKYMLASIDLHPATQPFLWSLPAIDRYALYTDLNERVASENPLVKSRFAEAEKDTKDLLKRLTKQDAEALIVPQLLDVFSRCPWPSLNVFINQVESYNIGQLVARSSSAEIAPLAMDMLPLILMQQFTAQGRVTKQRDGMFHEKWFRLLAQFAGDVAVAYDGFDFVVLVKLVLQQFAEGDFSQLVVLAQLVFRLSGLPPLANLSVPQLLALHSAEPVSSLVAAAISEQLNPQRERLLEGLRDADLTTELFVGLVYAYTQISMSPSGVPDAKVMASQLDDITNVALTYASLLDAPLTLPEGLPTEFVHAATRSRSGPFEFWNLRLHDIVIDQNLYAKFADIADAKSVERATLSHRLRVKSVKQQAANAPKPSAAERLSRLVMSPADALYTSRYVQELMPEQASDLLAREVILSVLLSATPLETESYALYVTDMLTWCYTNNKDTREIHAALTSAILDAAYPDAAYTPLSNTFSLMQRTLMVFPAFAEHGDALLSRVRLLTTATHGDLETAVKSLSPQLARRAELWQPKSESPAVVPTQELRDQLNSHNERLITRLIAGVKLVSKAGEDNIKDEREGEDQDDLMAKRGRRRARPRGRRWGRN